MIRRGCSAQRRNRKIDAMTGKGNNVHIAFNNNELIYLAKRLARLVQPVKFPSFVKKHGLR